MDWMVATGSVCLGLLVGALVGWFISEAKRIDHTALLTSVGILTGGGVLALMGFLSKSSLREIWLYPLGLLIGFIITMTLEFKYYDYYGKPRNKQQTEHPKSKARNLDRSTPEASPPPGP